jgi:hypothetical protein
MPCRAIAACAALPALLSGRTSCYSPLRCFCQFKDGFNGTLPPEWDTMNPFSDYGKGSELVDQTCGQMARYLGRIVGWYTNGGFHGMSSRCTAKPSLLLLSQTA